MKHLLPELPYALDALEPAMSRETLEFHYGKHLQTYIDNLNRLIQGTPFEDFSLEDIIMKAEGGILNNAAQTWNHTFFFKGLTPSQPEIPQRLLKAIEKAFGSFADQDGLGWYLTERDDSPSPQNRTPAIPCAKDCVPC